MRAAHGVSLLCAVLLAGCAATGTRTGTGTGTGPEPVYTPSTEKPRVNLSGYSANFKQGYADGCESASGRGERRNEARYRAEADYNMGWNDGYGACRKQR